MKTRLNLFIGTSVVFSAILSETGGARQLFRLGELGVVQLLVGPNVLRECEDVVRRKVPQTLPLLAVLLESCGLQQTMAPRKVDCDLAESLVDYPPDALVLAEAISAQPDWFVTHDKVHFLKTGFGMELPFQIGTPGAVLQFLDSYLTQI